MDKPERERTTFQHIDLSFQEIYHKTPNTDIQIQMQIQMSTCTKLQWKTSTILLNKVRYARDTCAN